MVLTNNFIGDLINQLKQRVIDNFNYIALGTDGTNPTENDTSLGNEIFRKQRQEYTEGLDYVIVTAWIASTEANGHTIREFGWFDIDTNGNLFAREIIGDLEKTSDIEILIDYKITFIIEQS